MPRARIHVRHVRKILALTYDSKLSQYPGYFSADRSFEEDDQ